MSDVKPDPTGIREHLATIVERIGRARGIDAEIQVLDALRVLEQAGAVDALEARLADSGRLLPEGGDTLDEWGPMLPGEERPLWKSGSEEYAREKLAKVRERHPDALLARRTWTRWPRDAHYDSPWEPVHD